MFEEYVDGPTLEYFLQFRGGYRLPRRSIFCWSLDLLRALDFLHCRNPMIIHRDVKPANLILSKDLNIMKLMDFGMSKAVSLSERETSIHSGWALSAAPAPALPPPPPPPSPVLLPELTYQLHRDPALHGARGHADDCGPLHGEGRHLQRFLRHVVHRRWQAANLPLARQGRGGRRLRERRGDRQ